MGTVVSGRFYPYTVESNIRLASPYSYHSLLSVKDTSPNFRKLNYVKNLLDTAHYSRLTFTVLHS
jgi:hypothetical protein